jgi:tRNA pseudouridine38-40 synthase
MLTPPPVGFRYFVELAFNGTPFHGWQIQPGAISVQEVLNHAIGTLTGQVVNLTGCGRTDAGVHASHFIAHFDVQEPVVDCIALTRKLNRFVRQPVRIDRIVPVAPDSHARFSAISRTYHYLVSRERSPFLNDLCWELTVPLDVEAMNAAARVLTGRHDFTSFSKLHTDVATNMCTVSEAGWSEYRGLLVFRITADRFLRNMVRAIAGTLIEAGKGKTDAAGVKVILDKMDRSAAGMSVPASGLYLSQVNYPPEIFITDPRTPFDAWITPA